MKTKAENKTRPTGKLSSVSIKKAALDFGADVVGVAPVGPVEYREEFIAWLEKGCAADMDYLKKNSGIRTDPRKLLDGAESVIVVGVNYHPFEDEIRTARGPYRVARYAWGEDYHRILRKMLRRLRVYLKGLKPELTGRICVDTAPFMDKYWARKAGLGWQGKHTNLVSRRFGNWLVLGGLLIDAPVDSYDRPHRDFCGKCTDCLDACPTGALVRPYVLDAIRCISYWTIESKSGTIPKEIRDKMNGRVFGCDACLSVCRFNRFEKPHRLEGFSRRPETGLIESGDVLAMDMDAFETAFKISPINRPGLSGIKRNIGQDEK